MPKMDDIVRVSIWDLLKSVIWCICCLQNVFKNFKTPHTIKITAKILDKHNFDGAIFGVVNIKVV